MTPMTPTSLTQTAGAQLLPLAKDLDQNKVTPGVLGFIVFALLGLAVWMLMKSMNRHMKKVDFEERPARPDPDGQGSGEPSEGAERAGEEKPPAAARTTKKTGPEA